MDIYEGVAERVENFPASDLSNKVRSGVRALLAGKYESRVGVPVAERHELRQQLQEVAFGHLPN
ncbi:MAG: hypothetical protein AAF483_21815 [Planctomycetota bacterium]